MEFVLIVLFLQIVGFGHAQVDYYLYTRENPEEKRIVDASNLDGLNPKNPVKFLIHGWGENADREYYSQMKEAYLTKADVNFIQVDWKQPAGLPYLIAATNTKTVGATIGKFIVKLNKTAIPLTNIHIIGHSLGAHVAGFAGKTVEQETGVKVQRISGLDPAGPAFENNPDTERLSDGDAVTVDITHTDAGYFGYEEPLGTVDFYPNGGHRPQPGCNILNPDLLQKSAAQIAFCSHVRSYLVFVESINSDDFIAAKCDSYRHYLHGQCEATERIIYGDDVPLDATGVYYFVTRARPLYALNDQIVTIT